jgi:hypothetical protein
MPKPSSKLVFAAALGFVSCRTESISDFGTNEVTANITALAAGTGSTTVSATFRKGASLTFLQLSSDDSVMVTAGTNSQKLSETSLLGVVTYSTSVPLDAEGTAFTVALQRKKDSGAPSSVATLPQAFDLTVPSGSFSRADAGPTLGWSNAGSDPMQLQISGGCIDLLEATLTSGATQYTVAAGALKKRSGLADGGSEVPDSCVATAQVDREHAGALDPGYAGGTSSGIQRRTVSFTTAP